MKVAFFGTPEICLPSLQFLLDSPGIELHTIISMPDRPAGRGKKLTSPAVIEFAKSNNLNYFQTSNINKESEFIQQLQNEHFDVFIVFAFAQFLGSKVLSIPKIGPFNIHTSLLPKYRGAAPIQYALINGDKETGVSIQKMVKKMDAGDIAVSHPIQITDSDNQTSLAKKLSIASPTALEKLFSDIKNDSLNFIAQDESRVTFAPSLNKTDGLLDFKNKSANEIVNQVRGLVPWPGCFFETEMTG